MSKTLKILKEKSQIPWLKIFTIKQFKELSECDQKTREILFECINTVELEMIDYFKPEKINIAMFGNYVPHLHVHIMARFKEDAYFPESMWGKQQREIIDLELKSFDGFIKNLKNKIETKMPNMIEWDIN